jgi:predicted DCC family thiol-disulfide oxidoreductase YuxK
MKAEEMRVVYDGGCPVCRTLIGRFRAGDGR